MKTRHILKELFIALLLFAITSVSINAAIVLLPPDKTGDDSDGKFDTVDFRHSFDLQWPDTGPTFDSVTGPHFGHDSDFQPIMSKMDDDWKPTFSGDDSPHHDFDFDHFDHHHDGFGEFHHHGRGDNGGSARPDGDGDSDDLGSAAPEPVALALISLGIAILALHRRLRRIV